MDAAILGGGCFWCMEPVFRALPGVTDVEPGYCGGHVDEPSYEQVCAGGTGHVEVVRVHYDAARITYRTLLQVFFATHDPTSLDRQGNDIGAQYASVVFFQDGDQQRVAQAVRDEVQGVLAAPVCTRIEAAGTFWPAEAWHRDYYRRNPEQGYCQFVISPKMAKFRKHFASLLEAAST